MTFSDRIDAGRRLGSEVVPMRAEHPIVVGLPRGGVVVAYEVAKALGAPLDVLVVRKLGAPAQPELALGAVGEGGVRVLNDRLVAELGLGGDDIERLSGQAEQEVADRLVRLRAGRRALPVEGRTVVLVDDGLATGATARAGARVLRQRGARRVVLAVPVCAPDAVRSLGEDVDQVVCLESPANLMAIGLWYDDFSQVSDGEVIRLLARAGQAGAADEEVEVDAGTLRLSGHLTIPGDATGLIVFAHGSGSGRHSPRNVAVARHLNDSGLATLLFDLLSAAEAADRSNVFDIPLLAQRLERATAWLSTMPEARRLPVGYFGASTGAAAALWAAGDLDGRIGAVVSRGGRPDLAAPQLERVTAPTLFIVGSLDTQVLEWNRLAREHLGCPTDLRVVEGASHLFEEPGKLTEVAELAVDWFNRHLSVASMGVR